MTIAVDPKIKNAVLVNSFDEYGLKCFKSDFDELMSNNFPIIPIIIDSFGGEIYGLLGMLDVIESSSRPVATVALGKAMSCGSILLACGTPGLRFIGPHSTVMIHDAGSFSFGKIEDLKADVGEAERLNNKIFDLLNQKCGKKQNYFQKIVASKKHANWYLTADETLKYGLVDHIGIPILSPSFEFELPSGNNNEKFLLSKKSRTSRKSRK